MTTPRRAATFVFAIHLGLVVLTQLENYLAYVHRAGDGAASVLWFVARIPLLQLQPALVAAVLAALAAVAVRRRWTARGFVVLLALVHVYLVFDQVLYKLFFDHMNLSQSESTQLDMATMWDSFVAELDRVFYLNVVVVLALTIASYRVLVGSAGNLPSAPAPLPHRRWRLATAAITAWVVMCGSLAPRWQNYNLDAHALISFGRSAFADPPAPANHAWAGVDIRTPRFGKATATPDEDTALLRARSQLAAAAPKNVITIVLESVGSVNLLANGMPDPELTPNLHALARNAVVFDRVYTSFPATTRSHLDRVTGGRTITWGSVQGEMTRRYLGSTLVRALSAMGYHTALFSAQRLGFENLGTIYAQQPYDEIFDPDKLAPEIIAEHEIHSWGIDERYALGRARTWLDSIARSGRPFALDLFTNVTHHPYGAPADHHAYAGPERIDAYRRALHFTDAVIGTLLDDLEARGLRDDTIIVITGDHGQAFGDRHRGNLTHKNHLYEENVKEFLIVANPAVTEHVRSQRIAAVGDLLPTVAGLVGAAVNTPGRDLFAAEHPLEIVYFHKNASPARWGLRDGRWKFTAGIDGSAPELFDLDRDPAEQIELSSTYPDRVAAFQRLCSAWYFQTNDDFLAHVAGPRMTSRAWIADPSLTTPGPKLATFGSVTGPSLLGDDHRLPARRRAQAMVVWTASDRPRPITVRWISPRGAVFGASTTVAPGTTRTTHRYEGPLPIEPGRWSFVVREGERDLLRDEVVVVDAAAS